MFPAIFFRPRTVATKLILIWLLCCVSTNLILAQDDDQTDEPSTTKRPEGMDDEGTATPEPAPMTTPTPKPTTTTPMPNSDGGGAIKKKKFQPPLYIEIDPRKVWPWTVNTIDKPGDKELWLIFKQKTNVAAFYQQRNIYEVDVDKYIRTIWVRRIQMLKAKYKCIDHWELPQELNWKTFETITDNCDNDPFMCANKPKGIWRRQYDSFLKLRNRTSNLVAYGQNGYNVYTLRKTIFILQRMRNFYLRCLNLAESSLDDSFDGPLED